MWVLFLCNKGLRVLKGYSETRVSKKGMELCDLDMWVNGIDVLEELLNMFCLIDDKGVIYIPEPQPRCFGSSAYSLGFELFHEQVGY